MAFSSVGGLGLTRCRNARPDPFRGPGQPHDTHLAVPGQQRPSLNDAATRQSGSNAWPQTRRRWRFGVQCAFCDGIAMDDDPSVTYFPRWTLRREGVIAPDERLPAAQTLALGLQHVVAMFGATVLAPLLMGFDPNVAILFSGVGTLIFFVLVGGRVPSYLGSSFAFIGVVIAATGYAGSGPNARVAVALGGIVA